MAWRCALDVVGEAAGHDRGARRRAVPDLVGAVEPARSGAAPAQTDSRSDGCAAGAAGACRRSSAFDRAALRRVFWRPRRGKGRATETSEAYSAEPDSAYKGKYRKGKKGGKGKFKGKPKGKGKGQFGFGLGKSMGKGFKFKGGRSPNPIFYGKCNTKGCTNQIWAK